MCVLTEVAENSSLKAEIANLKILSTDKAGINVDGAEGHRAALLKVKVKILQNKGPSIRMLAFHMSPVLWQNCSLQYMWWGRDDDACKFYNLSEHTDWLFMRSFQKASAEYVLSVYVRDTVTSWSILCT